MWQKRYKAEPENAWFSVTEDVARSGLNAGYEDVTILMETMKQYGEVVGTRYAEYRWIEGESDE